MAPRKGAGRKAAKNENAAALINALKFIGHLKAPPAGSPESYNHVIFDQGYAIGFDGVVAAGHPIPEGISGMPHAKLMAEALDNTDKTFTMTVRENGNFEITAGKYLAVVPGLTSVQLGYSPFPDQKQADITNPEALLKAFKLVNAVVVETGTTAAYSAVRIDDDILFATNGQIALEVRHNNALPPVIVPKQFITALLKTDKTISGVGINGATWETLTIWFTDGAWLRTNLYRSDTYPESIIDAYQRYTADLGKYDPGEIPAKLWATVKALIPFAENNRIIMREGIARTHMDRHQGAALELPDLHETFDCDGKAFLILEDIAASWYVGSDDKTPNMIFYNGGDTPLRGIMAGLPLLPEVDSAEGWQSPQQGTADASEGAGGWGMAANVAPPVEEGPGPAIKGEWKGGPGPDIGNDPEFLSQYHDRPVEDFEPETAFIFEGPDSGIQLVQPQPQGVASGWLNNLTDEDGGLNGE